MIVKIKRDLYTHVNFNCLAIGIEDLEKAERWISWSCALLIVRSGQLCKSPVSPFFPTIFYVFAIILG